MTARADARTARLRADARRVLRCAAGPARTTARAAGTAAGRLGLRVRALAVRGRRAREWSALRAATAGAGAPAPQPAAVQPAVTTVTLRSGPGGVAAARASAAAAPPGHAVCLLLDAADGIGAGWLDRLAAALAAGAAAATPTVVHPYRPVLAATPHDARVRHRGVELALDGGVPVLRARDAGSPAEPAPGTTEVAGASGACVLVERAAYDAAGGLPLLADPDLAVFDLCRRVHAAGGRVVAVGDSLVVDHRPAPDAASLASPVAPDGPAWRSYVEWHGAALAREADPPAAGTLRFAVTVSAPSAKVAPRWGDWHLAQAMARALERRGHRVLLQTLDHADDLAGRACDVHLVVRGLHAVRRTPGQVHVLWVISHPERVTPTECDDADLVLVASPVFAAELATRTRTPVEVMLQATDTDRFRPRPPDPRHRHDVVVVAKSRDVFRTAVADAVAAGLRPAIYGSGWERFVDPGLVVADYVANEDLPAVYASAGVVLNDHWDAMRAEGFVSNRLFDALACGTPVVSDEVPGIAELFAGAVPVYADADELRSLVDAILADPAAARERAARGRDLVLARHTFGHRAGELLDALHRHGLDRPRER